MPLTAGTRLGPYEILSALGAGGMGEVYKARDTRLDRTVAIKILPEALAADRQFRERFDREARAVSALDHPHICALYDVGEQDGTAFLVMPYLEGETLEKRLAGAGLKAAGPRLPIAEVLTLAIQIASALDAAHRAGIVHRDLKPGNIMLTKAGATLLDFGLAKSTTPAIAGAGGSILPTTPPNLTAQGAILGTFQYMAPEQLEGQDADARTDIFAFGAVVYEMLTGRKAFAGKSQASLIGAIMHAEPPPVSTLQPLTPAALDHVVRTCLAKDPDARWQTMGDVQRQLEWVASSSSAIAATQATPVARGGRWRGRELLAWRLVAALCVIVALAAGAVAVSHWREASPQTTQFVVLPPEGTVATGDMALSPNGRTVAFTGRIGGVTRLWIRGLDSVTPRAVPNSDGASYPFWSPDSASVGFFAGGRLKRVSAAGGSPQSLCDAPFGRGGTWGADDVIVFAPNDAAPLHRVPASGGTSTPVTTLGRQETSHRFPWFLPDGRHFLFGVGQIASLDVYVASVDGGERTSLLAGVSNMAYAEPGYVLFARENTLLAQRFDPTRLSLTGSAFPIAEDIGPNAFGHGPFSVSATGTLAYRQESVRSGLVWFDRHGARLTAINAPDRADQFALSPDGRQVAVRARRPGSSRSDIWLVDLQRNTPSRLMLTPGDYGGPTWSPDSKRLVFSGPAEDATSRSMFEKDVSGTAAAVQTLRKMSSGSSAGSASGGIWDWSRDGRFVVFVSGIDTGDIDIWALPRNGDPQPFPLVQGEGNQVQAQVSPDNRWLAYVSFESGSRDLYVQEFPTGQHRVKIPTENSLYPHWRGDSQELYYLTADARLMAVPVRVAGATLEPGPSTELFRIPALGSALGGGSYDRRRAFQPTADGQRFLVRTPLDDASSPLVVTLNWAAGLAQ